MKTEFENMSLSVVYRPRHHPKLATHSLFLDEFEEFLSHINTTVVQAIVLFQLAPCSVVVVSEVLCLFFHSNLPFTADVLQCARFEYFD